MAKEAFLCGAKISFNTIIINFYNLYFKKELIFFFATRSTEVHHIVRLVHHGSLLQDQSVNAEKESGVCTF